MKKYAMSKWFANGRGHVVRFHNSDVLLFTWQGGEDGAARYIEHVKRYVRNGKEFASLAALLRSVAAETRGPLAWSRPPGWQAIGVNKEEVD